MSKKHTGNEWGTDSKPTADRPTDLESPAVDIGAVDGTGAADEREELWNEETQVGGGS